jgi:hypothetical protein
MRWHPSGVETQRQWSDLVILRITAALLGLFSLVTVFAQVLLGGQPLPMRQAAWYTKALSTFADTLAFVRQAVWPATLFSCLLSHIIGRLSQMFGRNCHTYLVIIRTMLSFPFLNLL